MLSLTRRTWATGGGAGGGEVLIRRLHRDASTRIVIAESAKIRHILTIGFSADPNFLPIYNSNHLNKAFFEKISKVDHKSRGITTPAPPPFLI